MIALSIDLQRACLVKELGWDAGYLYFVLYFVGSVLRQTVHKPVGLWSCSVILVGRPHLSTKPAASVTQFCKLWMQLFVLDLFFTYFVVYNVLVLWGMKEGEVWRKVTCSLLMLCGSSSVGWSLVVLLY